MKIFISWSGEESRQIAEALRQWLPMIFETALPYMSAHDNEAGTRWSEVVSAELDETNFGVLCMTPSNLDSRWLLFEAGALGKSMGKARVVPLLHRLTPTDITAPLSQFMMKQADKRGVYDVVKAINTSLSNPRPDTVLGSAFDLLWPDLGERLAAVSEPDSGSAPQRSDRELLEELLALTRAQRQAPQVGTLYDIVRRVKSDVLGADRATILITQIYEALGPDLEGRTDIQGTNDELTATVRGEISAEAAIRMQEARKVAELLGCKLHYSSS